MTTRFFTLDGHTPVPCDDLNEWCQWFERTYFPRVALTILPSGVQISTVFLGMDTEHGAADAPPRPFETRVFGGDWDGWQRRALTWEGAEAEHAYAVASAREVERQRKE